MTDAYYEKLDESPSRGERFSASDFATGAWDGGVQNGAPVSALLVRALERCAPREGARLSRVVVDLLGAVPISDEIWVLAQRDRPGKRIELLSADMLAPGPDGSLRTVAKASGWRFAHHDSSALEFTTEPALPPIREPRLLTEGDSVGDSYLTSLEWCSLTDITTIPAECWARPLVDLVKGEVMTQVERLFTVADIANGLGTRITMGDWNFQNTDIVVHIHRVPDGDWIGVRAETNYGPDGVGVSAGTLFDQRGPVAKVQQAQLLRPR
jgi:hypothetical protein